MGEIAEIHLTKKQGEAFSYLNDDFTVEVLFGGSAGGGKSFLGCFWLIQCCLKWPGSRWLMGRAKLLTLTQTTLVTFFIAAKKFGMVADVHFTYNAQQHVINFQNGSQILLRDMFLYPSDPNMDSLGSLEIAGAFLDEISQVSDKAREIVKSRLGWKLPDGDEIPRKLLMTTNPCKHYAYRDFYLPASKGTLESDKAFIPALPSENKHLSQGRQAALNALSGVDRKRLLLGQWEYDSDPNAIIEYDKIIDLFNNDQILVTDDKGTIVGTKRADGSTYRDKCISVDVARLGKDKTIILVWIGLYIVEFKILEKATTDQSAAVIKAYQKLYTVPSSLVVIDSDGVGGGLVDQIKGSLAFLNGGKPLHNENYKNLKAQVYHKLAEVLNANEMCFQTDNADLVTLITAELEQVKRKSIDTDGKIEVISKEEIKAALGRSPDFSDAMMMRCYLLVKKRVTEVNKSYSFLGFNL